MPDNSISKWKPQIDLRTRSHMALAMHLVHMLELHFGARVNLQKDLLFLVHTQDRITNGAAHAMVEALAEKGFFRIERWGPGRRYKRIIVLRRPGTVTPRIRSAKKDFPAWAWQYYPGPPNHRRHLARHLALAAKYRGPPVGRPPI